MSDHEAVVTRIVGDFALLETTAEKACGACSAKGGGCGGGDAPRQYAVRNDIGARAGEAVIVSVPDGTVLKAAALSYLMPVLCVIAGAAAGTAWGGEGVPAVAGAVLGLAVGIVSLRLLAALAWRGRPALKLRRRVVSIDKEN